MKYVKGAASEQASANEVSVPYAPWLVDALAQLEAAEDQFSDKGTKVYKNLREALSILSSRLTAVLVRHYQEVVKVDINLSATQGGGRVSRDNLRFLIQDGKASEARRIVRRYMNDPLDTREDLKRILSFSILLPKKGPSFDPQKFVLRSLSTGWGNSHKAGSIIDRLKFEFSPKGLSRTRCATIAGSNFHFDSGAVGLSFKDSAVVKAFRKDVCSYPTGRKQTSRRNQAWANYLEITLERAYKVRGSYPELYIRPKARPSAIVILDKFSLTRELAEFAKSENVPIIDLEGNPFML